MKDIFIEKQREILRIAIRDKNKLDECYIEEENNSPLPGEIYKGIVKNIVPAIKCAFIDIGYKKNCYMYMDDKFNNTKIKKNDEVLVEIIKEEYGDKGPKVTNAISIPGRYSVLMTLNKNISFSKSIESVEFKEAAKSTLKKPEDVGLMIRTNGEKVSIDTIQNEIDALYEIYMTLIKEAAYSIKPKLLYSDEGVLDKILRDSLDENTEKIIVDDIESFNHIKTFIDKKSDIEIEVLLHDESRGLFDYYGIEKEILHLRGNRINLKNGGYIVIDKTEAMYVIDVNSGKNVKANSIEKTALTTNLEAAEEIVRQVRLRNLNGIILIDFINIENTESKKRILETLKEGFIKDKNKTVIYPFTELNLVQIARRRRGKSLSEYMEEECRTCSGRGKRLKLSYLKNLIRNEMLKVHKEQGIRDIYIEISDNYEKDIKEDVIEFIKSIEALDKTIYVKFIHHMEGFKIEPLIFANQIQNAQIYKIYG